MQSLKSVIDTEVIEFFVCRHTTVHTPKHIVFFVTVSEITRWVGANGQRNTACFQHTNTLWVVLIVFNGVSPSIFRTIELRIVTALTSRACLSLFWMQFVSSAVCYRWSKWMLIEFFMWSALWDTIRYHIHRFPMEYSAHFPWLGFGWCEWESTTFPDCLLSENGSNENETNNEWVIGRGRRKWSVEPLLFAPNSWRAHFAWDVHAALANPFAILGSPHRPPNCREYSEINKNEIVH